MIKSSRNFKTTFQLLTGHPPFPWQEELFAKFLQGEFPQAANLPTGLGKTSILVIWLIALAERPDVVPRLLAYVVNRRTVVDQSTHEMMEVRRRLPQCEELHQSLAQLCSQQHDSPLAISTLRGQFADNQEWLIDPARPAIVAGTVDMIGSRLLFSGYRSGFKSKPRHAGMLGQNSLLIHDEAHLEPAFQSLLESVVAEQTNGQRFPDRTPMRVMELTATSRTGTEDKKPFALSPDDFENKVVQQRVHAKKGIAFLDVANEKEIAPGIAGQAMEYADTGKAVLIFARKVEDVEKIESQLTKSHKQNKQQPHVQVLTGTMRGKERDELVRSDNVFARFKPDGGDAAGDAPETVFLICTAAGEVGVNMSSDHLICDLTTFDSMAQRFGRVNRFGHGDACIDVVVEKETKADNAYQEARRRTLALLKSLPARDDGKLDASPAALAELPSTECAEAFSPAPAILPVDEMLFDAWSMTTIRQEMPGRPPVEDWLHGVPEDPIPRTQVAWREEVADLTGVILQWNPALGGAMGGEHTGLTAAATRLLEVFPVEPHEILTDNTTRVFKHLKKLAQRLAKKADTASLAQQRVWLVDPQGRVTTPSLEAVVDAGAGAIEHQLILLPPAVGGLKKGLLDGAAPGDESLDVCTQWSDEQDVNRRERIRFASHDGALPPAPPQMRVALDLLLSNPEPEEPEGSVQHWLWYVRNLNVDSGNSASGPFEQKLDTHLKLAGSYAKQLVEKLEFPEDLKQAVVVASRFHDLGKDRNPWQLAIGNTRYPEFVLAKSGPGAGRSFMNAPYRHEFGSLLDIQREPEFQALDPIMQDLVLHLIATHHGRARPHFPSHEVVDTAHPDADTMNIAAETPQRFARLMRRYGRWGLAWLENLVHAADVVASTTQNLDELEAKSCKP